MSFIDPIIPEPDWNPLPNVNPDEWDDEDDE
jgi:hypothetical protein